MILQSLLTHLSYPAQPGFLLLHRIFLFVPIEF